ncbi:MAG: M23 family metallopeptidase [Holophagaceae bacterium]|nr:M23 family metallopeptidase [Holophagaceae bacterium]
MSRKSQLRVADRLSHPHPDRFLSFVVVLTRRTFTFTVRKKFVYWTIGLSAGICLVAFTGSWYGLWATKKIMSYSELEQETREQQQQLQESLEQAGLLQQDIDNLSVLVHKLVSEINPKSTSSEPSKNVEKSNDIDTESAQKVSALQDELNSADGRLKAIQTRTAPILHAWFHTPAVWPTVGTITSVYGQRIHPAQRIMGGGGDDLSHHAGIDISNALGTPIQATANGTVIFAGQSGNYGNTVIIRHSQEFETLYAHLHRINVSVGQEVGRGSVLGTMGSTGRSTGTHLHYEVRKKGQAVNPRPYLKLQLQWLKGIK